jgi:hypothetical protein
MRVVEVTWLDAWHDPDECKPEALEAEHGPIEVASVGYEVRNDDYGVMIAACREDDGTFKRVLFVPAGMIKRVRRLRG